MPQERIDEEAHPGILADILDSTSSSSSSGSSSSDSDTTSGSHSTAKRFRRAFRRRRRKSNSQSEDTRSVPSHLSSPAPELNIGPTEGSSECHRASVLNAILNGDEGDIEEIGPRFDGVSKVRDFERNISSISSRVSSPESKTRRRKRSSKKYSRRKKSKQSAGQIEVNPDPPPATGLVDETFATAAGTEATEESATHSRMKPTSWRPGLPKLLSQNVFMEPFPPQLERPDMSRASSMPDLRRANTIIGRGFRPSHVEDLVTRPIIKDVGDESDQEDEEHVPQMSRTAAVVMLLVSTGLVALCAEFLVDAIPDMTSQSSVSQAFIGLIILPIVGNAAEHVTAVTVAMKNKMDLAIGVAVGSSIQIGNVNLFRISRMLMISALFVTPLVVILGWCISRQMSLYFTIFETISLFVTAFVVNFLVLDGKSNYLEGILLIASYVIIA
jgi:Ca2+:H+ antiporter